MLLNHCLTLNRYRNLTHLTTIKVPPRRTNSGRHCRNSCYCNGTSSLTNILFTTATIAELNTVKVILVKSLVRQGKKERRDELDLYQDNRNNQLRRLYNYDVVNEHCLHYQRNGNLAKCNK